MVRKLDITGPISAGTNERGRKVEITPYDGVAHSDFFTHAYSEDNKDHLGYFVTKGWSPSIQKLKDEHGDPGYLSSDEYTKARRIRHQNTLERNSKDRYFFTILEDGRPIGYTSVVDKIDEETKNRVGRVSVMIGHKEDCDQESGTLALRKMLEELAQRTDFKFYDGKVEQGNNPSLAVARKVFGKDVERTRQFENTYKTLDGQSEIRKVDRQYFRRPQAHFL